MGHECPFMHKRPVEVTVNSHIFRQSFAQIYRENRMNLASSANNYALTTALTEPPALILSFYSYGVLLRKQDGEVVTEYPVDVRRAKRRE